MRAVLWVASAALVLGATVLLPVTAADPEPDVFRLMHVYKGQPISFHSCTRIEQEVLCSGSVPDDIEFSVPSGLGRVDITASLTVQYGTSAGDGGRLIATLKPPMTRHQMRPGPFTLSPAADGTTATATWVVANQQPTEGAFAFGFEIRGTRGNRLPYRVAVSETVLVLTATPG